LEYTYLNDPAAAMTEVFYRVSQYSLILELLNNNHATDARHLFFVVAI
jgi:hypothetical protein